jgi:hypothetical protein
MYVDPDGSHPVIAGALVGALVGIALGVGNDETEANLAYPAGGAAAGATAGAAVAALPFLKRILKDVDFDGPSKGWAQAREGRICQVRYKKKIIVLRLDYHPNDKYSSEGSVLHAHVGSMEPGIPLSPSEWWARARGLFD